MKRDTPDPNPGPSSGGTKPQNATLTALQSSAVSLIAAGKTYTEVAEALKVDRKTLWTWRKDNPAFNEAVEQTLAAFRDEVASGLVQSGRKAMDTLAALAERAEDEGIRLKAATELLNRIDDAVSKGSTGSSQAAVTVQVMAADAAAELRKRREQGE